MRKYEASIDGFIDNMKDVLVESINRDEPEFTNAIRFTIKVAEHFRDQSKNSEKENEQE